MEILWFVLAGVAAIAAAVLLVLDRRMRSLRRDDRQAWAKARGFATSQSNAALSADWSHGDAAGEAIARDVASGVVEGFSAYVADLAEGVTVVAFRRDVGSDVVVEFRRVAPPAPVLASTDAAGAPGEADAAEELESPVPGEPSTDADSAVADGAMLPGFTVTASHPDVALRLVDDRLRAHMATLPGAATSVWCEEDWVFVGLPAEAGPTEWDEALGFLPRMTELLRTLPPRPEDMVGSVEGPRNPSRPVAPSIAIGAAEVLPDAADADEEPVGAGNEVFEPPLPPGFFEPPAVERPSRLAGMSSDEEISVIGESVSIPAVGAPPEDPEPMAAVLPLRRREESAAGAEETEPEADADAGSSGESGDAVTGDAVTGDAVTGDAVTGDAVTGEAVTGEDTAREDEAAEGAPAPATDTDAAQTDADAVPGDEAAGADAPDPDNPVSEAPDTEAPDTEAPDTEASDTEEAATEEAATEVLPDFVAVAPPRHGADTEEEAPEPSPFLGSTYGDLPAIDPADEETTVIWIPPELRATRDDLRAAAIRRVLAARDDFGDDARTAGPEAPIDEKEPEDD